MPRLRLTHLSALAAQCEPGKTKTDWYDDALKGFVLECRATGGKTYYLRYTDAAGRQKQHKIAAYGDISFANARRAAERLKSDVVMGGDPVAAKAEARAVPLYLELAAQHMVDAELHCRSFDSMQINMKRHLLPRWGRMRLTNIDGRAVAHWMAAKRDEGLAPATVEKLRALLSRSFELGKRWGIAGCEINPARGVQRKPLNNARERFLTADEAALLREAASASRNVQLRPIVDLLMLTGARVGELLRAQWAHVDLDRRAWLIPTSKSGKARHVPLSQAAVDVIAALPRFDGCPWLLPNTETLKPFVTIKHGWQAARKAAGLDDLRIHDLRHSSASFMINNGVDLFTVGKVLGHASYQSTQRYSHLANDTLLAAVEAGAAKQRSSLPVLD